MPWVAVTLQCIGNTFERKVGLARIDQVVQISSQSKQTIRIPHLYPIQRNLNPRWSHMCYTRPRPIELSLISVCTVQTCSGWAKHNITNHQCPRLRGDKTQTVCLITAWNEGGERPKVFVLLSLKEKPNSLLFSLFCKPCLDPTNI